VRALAPDGVTVVADFVGGVLDATLAVLAEGGRHASIADPAVREAGGQWMWVRPVGEDLTALARLAAAGEVDVDIAGTFPLADLPQAFARSQEGHVPGKLVVEP
jgi:NADPH:quinone reductase-like Zn-dependent oxidoreductase